MLLDYSKMRTIFLVQRMANKRKLCNLKSGDEFNPECTTVTKETTPNLEPNLQIYEYIDNVSINNKMLILSKRNTAGILLLL